MFVHRAIVLSGLLAGAIASPLAKRYPYQEYALTAIP